MKRRKGQQFGSEPATRLSRRRAKFAWIGRILRLARGSLLGLSVLAFSSSCIVADPPQYTDPGRTRPELDLYLADPVLSQVFQVYSNTTGATFSIDVRSEDAGEELFAVFWEDYNTTSPNSIVLNTQRVPPSTYNDPISRRITSTPFTPGTGQTGCHIISLIVAHASTFFSKDLRTLDQKLAKTDAAIVSWWVNVNPPADAQNTLSNCPTQIPLPAP